MGRICEGVGRTIAIRNDRAEWQVSLQNERNGRVARADGTPTRVLAGDTESRCGIAFLPDQHCGVAARTRPNLHTGG